MNKYMIFIVAFLFIEDIAAQGLDWIVKPVISDTETISVHPGKNALIKVEREGMFGVKNKKNEILIPIIHKELDISTDQKYIYIGRTNKLSSIKHILNIKGDTLKFDRKLIYNHPFYSNHYFEERYDLTKFIEKHGLLLESFRGKNGSRKYRIKNSSNRIIIDSLSGHESYLQEGYLAARKKSGGIKFYNKKGEIIFEDDISKTVSSNGKGLFLVQDKILNSKFDKIYENKGQYIGMIEGYDLYYTSPERNGKNEVSIYDLNQKLLIPETYNQVKQVNSDWLLLSNMEMVQLYSLKEKKVIFKINRVSTLSLSKVKGCIKVVAGSSRSGKNGAYNFLKNELILDTIYEKVKLLNDRIVTFENIDADNYVCTAYTNKGKKLFQVENEEISALKHSIFLVKGDDEVNRIVDAKGNSLLEVEHNTILRKKHDDWVYNFDVRRNEVYYRIKDISEGKIIEYKDVKKMRHKSMCNENIYIASKNDKFGLFSSEDGLIVPFEYDQMDFSDKIERSIRSYSHSEVVKVVKDGKWGAFINPCVINNVKSSW